MFTQQEVGPMQFREDQLIMSVCVFLREHACIVLHECRSVSTRCRQDPFARTTLFAACLLAFACIDKLIAEALCVTRVA